MAVLFTDNLNGTDTTDMTVYGSYANVMNSMRIDNDATTSGCAPNSAANDCAVRRSDVTPADAHQKVTVIYPADLATRASTAYSGGAIRMSTSVNTWVGFYVNKAGRLFLIEYVAGTLNTLYGAANTLVSASSVVDLEIDTDNITQVTIDSVLQDGTGGTTDLRFTTAVTATGQIGACGYNNGNTIIDSLEGSDFAAAGGTIATVDSPVLDAEQDNNLTTTGFGGEPTTLTLEVTGGAYQINLFGSITGTSGTYTFDMPDVAGFVVNTLGSPFESTNYPHTITISDGTDTDDEVIVPNPKTGWAAIDVGETPSTDVGHVFENFTGFLDDISAVSVANPSQLTLADSSTWTDGQEVTLAGFDTTPDINGTQVITIVDGTHVSIPVNVTAVVDGAGTMLTGAVGDHGQVYHPTANNTSVLGTGEFDTDQLSGSIGMLWINPVSEEWELFNAVIPTAATAAVTGTATGSITEVDIVAGGKTIIVTLEDDTWVATAGDNNAITTAIIAGIDSAQAEAAGWDAQVKTTLTHANITRTSSTVLTIVLPAVAGYDITANESITMTIPASALTSAEELVATPVFIIRYTSLYTNMAHSIAKSIARKISFVLTNLSDRG